MGEAGFFCSTLFPLMTKDQKIVAEFSKLFYSSNKQEYWGVFCCFGCFGFFKPLSSSSPHS